MNDRDWLVEERARVDDWSVADGYVRNDCERALACVEAADRLTELVDAFGKEHAGRVWGCAEWDAVVAALAAYREARGL